MKARLVSDETQRLIQLYRMGILDTPAEAAFDDLVRVVALIFDTPFAAVTLIDHSRQWFKAFEGTANPTEIPRNESICTYTIQGTDIFVVPDTLLDPRFSSIPLVVGEPKIRFYAGVPLQLNSGANIGALCVLGQKPSQITAYQQEMLTLLGRQVVNLIEQHHKNQTNAWLSKFFADSNLMVALLDLEADVFVYTNPTWDVRCKTPNLSGLQTIQRLLPELDFSDTFSLANLTASQPGVWLDLKVHFSTGLHTTANVQLIPEVLAVNAKGSQRKLLVVIDDQVGIRLAQQEAREATARMLLLEKVATITRNPVIITNANRKIEWVNQAFELSTGYTLDEVVGRIPGSFLQGKETDSNSISRIGLHLSQGRGLTQEILNYAKNGRKYWLELDIQPVHNDRGLLTHFIAVQTDITRRKEQEELLSAAHAESERVSHLKSRFLANISHEIRTPLNGILGIAQYLERKVPEAFRQDVSILFRSGEHLLNLLNEMIDLSALEAGMLDLHLRPFSPIQVLQEVSSLFVASARAKNLLLELDLNDGFTSDWVNGDAKRLRQVLMNLLGNAVKFTRTGGITLSCRQMPGKADKLLLRFTVSDTGPGIKIDDQKRIFRRFNQSDAPEAGAGLGLSISRQILRRMQSDLSLDSKPGEGSRFIFEIEFERALSEAVSPACDSIQDQVADYAGIGRILVVDDNETNLRVMQGLMESLGVADIHLASSGQEALDNPGSINAALVFVDISMPEMDGFEFLRQFKLQTHGDGLSPILVACTAFSSDTEKNDFLARGFDAHVAKPVTLDALVQVFQKHCRATSDTAQSDVAARPQSAVNQVLREKMGNNSKLIRHFLELLVEHDAANWRNIHEAVATGDDATLNRSIHTLKGHLAYFGEGHPAYQHLLRVEQLLKTQQPISKTQLAGFEQAASELISGARHELSNWAQTPADEG